MIKNSGMTCENYSHTLQGWANNPNSASFVTFGDQTGMEYSSEVTDAIDYLINDLNWDVSGLVEGSCSLTVTDLTFTKEVDLSTAELGNVLTYTFTVENTGDVDLFEVEIIDNDLTGLSAINYTWPNADGELAAGEIMTATATYTVTQDDVDNGSVENLATLKAKDENGDPLDETESTDDLNNPGKPGIAGSPTITVISAAPTADLTFTKEVDLSTAELGNVLTYTFTVENTGDVDLFEVEIIDNDLTGLSAINYTWPNADGELAAGEIMTATATYTVTQDDVDNGSVENLATLKAKDENGDPLDETESTDDLNNPGKPGIAGSPTITVISAAPTADLTFTKEVDLSTAELGDILTYTFTVENTGDVNLFEVEIIDNDLTGLSAINYTWPNADGELAAGEIMTATATYTVTQDDVDNGSVENLATLKAKDENGDPLDETESTDDLNNPGKPGIAGSPTITVISAAPTADLTFTKEVDLSTAELGNVLTYTFTVENTGDVDLFEVEIIDNDLTGLSAINYTWPNADGELAAGEIMTATATYTVTQDDVDNGSVENLATLKAKDENGDPLDETESTDDLNNPGKPGIAGSPTITVISAAPTADLTFTKEVDLSTAELGNVLTYTFTVENTGDVDLFEVEIIDNDLTGLSAINYTWPNADGELAAGEIMTATATYTVTQDDVDNGSVENLATLKAKDENGDPLDETESTDDLNNPGKPGIAGSPTITIITTPPVVATPFVTIWNTGNPGASGNGQIIIPAQGQYNYTWENLDNPAQQGSGSANGTIVLSLPALGEFKLSITPTGPNPFHQIRFNDSGDKLKIISEES